MAQTTDILILGPCACLLTHVGYIKLADRNPAQPIDVFTLCACAHIGSIMLADRYSYP